MQPIYDIIIIGGGPAGYSAALYSARAGFDTLLIEKMSAGGQLALTDVIENYPGFEEGIDGFTLGMKMQQTAERFGARTEYGEVKSVDFSKEIKSVNTETAEYRSRAVIIATGADPRPLGLAEEQTFLGKGVHYCAHCDGRFYKDKTVAVVGGGNSAVSDALYLSRLAQKVYLIHRRDTLRATKIYHDPLLNTKNVEFLWNSKVSEIIAETRVNGIKVQNVNTDEINTVSVDGLFVSIGRSPCTDVFKGKVALDDFGYIIADETCKTNIPGVFAAGDVRTKALRQVVTAVSDGATAVHFAEQYIEKYHNL
ncbi:MAG: thioredoxin-disulfide reductase [Clostridia bacterium]|nr:thioredoxin-disulfide reductase [Clostridia bacterium]